MSTASAAPGFLGRGEAPSRHGVRSHWKRFLGGFLGFLVVITVIGAVSNPSKPAAACHKAMACGVPPVAPQSMVATNETVWRSSALGFQIRYAADGWTTHDQSPTSVRLDDRTTDSLLIIQGAAAGGASAGTLLAREVQNLRSRVLGLTADAAVADTVLGPELALHAAVAISLRGTLDTPQGPGAPVDVVVLAGGNSSVTLTATLITANTHGTDHMAALQDADFVLGTLRLAEDQGV